MSTDKIKVNENSSLEEIYQDILSLEDLAEKWIARGFNHYPARQLTPEGVATLETWLQVKSDLNMAFYNLYKKALNIFHEIDNMSEFHDYFAQCYDAKLHPYPKSISFIHDKILIFKKKFLIGAEQNGFVPELAQLSPGVDLKKEILTEMDTRLMNLGLTDGGLWDKFCNEITDLAKKDNLKQQRIESTIKMARRLFLVRKENNQEKRWLVLSEFHEDLHKQENREIYLMWLCSKDFLDSRPKPIKSWKWIKV